MDLLSCLFLGPKFHLLYRFTFQKFLLCFLQNAFELSIGFFGISNLKQLSLPKLGLSDGNSTSRCIGHDAVAHVNRCNCCCRFRVVTFFSLLLSLNLLQNALKLLLKLEICLLQEQLQVASFAWLASCQQNAPAATG